MLWFEGRRLSTAISAPLQPAGQPVATGNGMEQAPSYADRHRDAPATLCIHLPRHTGDFVLDVLPQSPPRPTWRTSDQCPRDEPYGDSPLADKATFLHGLQAGTECRYELTVMNARALRPAADGRSCAVIAHLRAKVHTYTYTHVQTYVYVCAYV